MVQLLSVCGQIEHVSAMTPAAGWMIGPPAARL